MGIRVQYDSVHVRKHTSHSIDEQGVLFIGDFIKCPEHVTGLWAWGRELTCVRNDITNVPFSNRTTVVWHGSFAQFIACNLNLSGEKDV